MSFGAEPGLSPRTRGSPRDRAAGGSADGPIPADAGEPWRLPPHPWRGRAYPRGRGGAREVQPNSAPSGGLSPRTRGSQIPLKFWNPRAGPIPADAGEPAGSACGVTSRGAYPRGRGGASVEPQKAGAPMGLSPRTRGSPQASRAPTTRPGPIPADAGEPWSSLPSRTYGWAYPRGRGGAAPASAPVGP